MKEARVFYCGLILIFSPFLLIPFVYAQGQESQVIVNMEPSYLGVVTKGDQEKFEEDHWTSRNGSGGISSMSILKQLNSQDYLEFTGRAIAGNNDFDADLNFSREGLGSLEVAFKQFRKYYDGTGGFYSPLASPVESRLTYGQLDRGLHLDIGNFKIEGVLAKEDSPEYFLGYEREFRSGKKSLLGWGTVAGGLSISPKIYPTYLDLDEAVNKFKIGMKHETRDSEVSLEQRWENKKAENQHIVGQTYTLSTGVFSSIRQKFEN